jgi:hypothetical protein
MSKNYAQRLSEILSRFDSSNPAIVVEDEGMTGAEMTTVGEIAQRLAEVVKQLQDSQPEDSSDDENPFGDFQS